MSRTIVFGNSHVGAFKAGWRRIVDDGGHASGEDIAFFGVPHPHFNLMRLDAALTFALPDDAIARDPVTAGKIAKINGATSISLRDADTVIWAGAAVPHSALAQIAVRFDIDGLREVGAPSALSRAAFDAACDGMIEALLPGPAWRGWSSPRLLLLPIAMPGVGVVDSRDAKHGVWRLLRRRPKGFAALMSVYFKRFESALRRLDIGLIRQPRETLVGRGLTDQRYCRGSTRLGGAAHPEDDFIHMNADFGAVCMKALTAAPQMA